MPWSPYNTSAHDSQILMSWFSHDGHTCRQFCNGSFSLSTSVSCRYIVLEMNFFPFNLLINPNALRGGGL